MKQSCRRGFLLTVLAIITHLDGTNAQLFHVEHCDNRNWQYQLRSPDSILPDCREWSSPPWVGRGDSATIALPDPNCICEARWKWQDESDDTWRAAVPHEWGECTVDFQVVVRQARDFRMDPVLHIAALVRGRPSAWSLEMPRVEVPASAIPAPFLVSGVAMSPGPSSVLRHTGEFSTSNDAFAVFNAATSQVTLREVPPSLPAALPFRGSVAVRIGTLSPDEIEMLKAWVASYNEKEDSNA